jgi:hypothetical protein
MMGFLQAYQAMLQDEDNRLKEERAQRDEDEKRKVLGNRSALADQINDQIKKLVYGAIEPDEGAIKTQSAAAGQEAASARIGQQYEAGQTLTPQQVNTIADAANEKTPSLGNLPALRARENLINIGKPGKNLPRLSSIKDYGYDLPDMPTQTPEGDIAAQEAQEAKEAELRKVKPNYSKLGVKVASELSGPMLKAEVTDKDIPLFGMLDKGALRQAYEAKNGPASSEPFENGTPEYAIAEHFYKEKVPPSQWRMYYSGLGKMPASKPRMLATILVNHPDYDEVQLEEDFKKRTSFGSASGQLEPSIIKKKTTLTNAQENAKLTDELQEKRTKQAGMIKGAQERAALAPDIVGPKIDKQARGITAGVVLKQRMAAQKALSTFDDSYDKQTKEYRNITNPIYTDLMLDYARIINPNAQVGIELVHEIKQGSLRGDVVGTWNYIMGTTETTAPQEVLKLFYNRIKGLSVDLDKQYYNLTTDKNIPVNSDEDSNPLKPVEPEASTPGKTDFRKKYNY